jgi:hypothetical protein
MSEKEVLGIVIMTSLLDVVGPRLVATVGAVIVLIVAISIVDNGDAHLAGQLALTGGSR